VSLQFTYRTIANLFAGENPPPFIVIKDGPGQLYEDGTVAQAIESGHVVERKGITCLIRPKAATPATTREAMLTDALRGLLGIEEARIATGAFKPNAAAAARIQAARDALGYCKD